MSARQRPNRTRRRSTDQIFPHRTINNSFKLSLYSLLLVLLVNHHLVIPTAGAPEPDKHEAGNFFSELPDVHDGEADLDGFSIDESLLDEAELDSEHQKLVAKETTTKHSLENSCPFGYFTCHSGECIAAKWHCDGHYDCDDFTDELNCTNTAAPSMSDHEIIPMVIPKAVNASAPKPDGSIVFKSPVEPLMIFSTGTSIRGFWMKSRIYFDIVNIFNPKTAFSKQTSSITSALSVFFDMFSVDPHTGDLTDSKSDESQAKPKRTIVGVDLDPNNKEVYWVELGKDPGVHSVTIEDEEFSEVRQRRQYHSGLRNIVEFGLVAPEDIALDTVGKNAYITDAGLPAIVVCSMLHSHCKTLISDRTIHKPRAIIADSTVGWIIYTDWGDHPGIFLASMDGRFRDTLIDTEIVWPNGLAADYDDNVLFWADARLNKIERVDLNSRKRVKIIKEIQTNPFSISQFEDRIYWSDWAGNDIKTCDKNTGNNTRNLVHAQDIYGIHIYHPDMHKHEPANPCWSKHCSHLCLLSPSVPAFSGRVPDGSIGAACACPNTMALSAGDHSTCYEAQLSFVLVNDKNYIAQVFPDKIGLRVVEPIIYSKDHAIQDIASDWIHYKLFFFDASKQLIYSADIGDNRPKITRIAPAGKSVRGLLFDSWSDNLFWLDPDAGTMSLYSVRGKFVKVLRKNLERPTSLVLDSRNRVLYMSQLGTKPKIVRISLNGLGSEQKQQQQQRDTTVTLIEGDIGLPIALHLDELQQRLYWADAGRETIESIGLDIKSRTTGVLKDSRQRHRRFLGTVLAFAIYRNAFFWTRQDDNYLYKASMDSKVSSRPMTFKLPVNPSLEHPDTDHKRLITVDPRHEAIASPCQRARCSHGCQLDQNHEAVCFCPDHLHLQASNRSNCVDGSAEPSGPGGPSIGQLARKSAAAGAHLAAPSDPKGGLRAATTLGGGGVVPAHVRTSPEENLADRRHFDELSASLNHDPHEPADHVQLDSRGSALMEHAGQLAAGQHDQSGHPAGQPASLEAANGPSERRQLDSAGNRMVWLIVLLLLLSITGLVTVVSLLVLYRQGRLPRQVSQLSVSFMAPGSRGAGGADKDKAMLLLDTDS